MKVEERVFGKRNGVQWEWEEDRRDQREKYEHIQYIHYEDVMVKSIVLCNYCLKEKKLLHI